MTLETTDYKCHHGVILIPDNTACSLCKLEARLMNMKPPYTLRCWNELNCDLDKNGIYTVVAFVASGYANGEELPGVMLKIEDKDGRTVTNGKIYKASRFDLITGV